MSMPLNRVGMRVTREALHKLYIIIADSTCHVGTNSIKKTAAAVLFLILLLFSVISVLTAGRQFVMKMNLNFLNCW